MSSALVIDQPSTGTSRLDSRDATLDAECVNVDIVEGGNGAYNCPHTIYSY